VRSGPMSRPPCVRREFGKFLRRIKIFAIDLSFLRSSAVSNRITLRRFWLGVTDMSESTISDQQLTTA
jgi:hypothetical protein